MGKEKVEQVEQDKGIRSPWETARGDIQKIAPQETARGERDGGEK